MHKKVLAEYQKSGMALPPESTNEESIRVFYAKQKLSQKPIKRSIWKIVRVREKGQDYFYYGQELTSEDALGNEIHVYMQPIGKFEKPSFEYIVDPNTKSRIATSIKSFETIHELKFPQDFTPELQQDVYSKVDLVLVTPRRKYGGYELDDFLSKSFDDLLTWGRYGTFAPTTQMISIADQKQTEKDKEKRQRVK